MFRPGEAHEVRDVLAKSLPRATGEL